MNAWEIRGLSTSQSLFSTKKEKKKNENLELIQLVNSFVKARRYIGDYFSMLKKNSNKPHDIGTILTNDTDSSASEILFHLQWPLNTI